MKGPFLIENSKMYLHSNDPSVSPAILKGEYEILETALIKKLVKEGMVVCDIGAHIGYYSLLFSRLVGKHGKVFAFEPDLVNFQILKKNKSINKLNNLILNQTAVSDINGKTKLFLCKTNSGDHRIYDTMESREFISTKVTTLDNYFRDFDGKIDLIKMDIQGAEMKALEKMVNCIRNNRNIIVITEFWPHGLRSFGSDPKYFLQLLSQYGFKIFNINEQKRRIEETISTKLIRFYKNGAFTNLLCVRQKADLSQLNVKQKKTRTITSYKQLKDSYEKIWTEGDLLEETAYYRWIISLMGDVKGKKLLDVGCGAGYLLEQALEKEINATGIDISETAIKKAKTRAPKAKLIQGIGEKLQFPSHSFDIVTCLGSLEHFLNPEKALKEMYRVLKRDGLVCIVLPNRWAIDAIFEGAFRGVSLSHGQELERFYSYQEAHDLLTGSRFKIIKALGYNRPYSTYVSTGTKKSYFANMLYQKIYKIIRWKIPVRLSYVFVFLLKKKEGFKS